jgi:hypothetical protein
LAQGFRAAGTGIGTGEKTRTGILNQPDLMRKEEMGIWGTQWTGAAMGAGCECVGSE